MLAHQAKWWRWLGQQTPDGGVVATYAGGKKKRYAYFRPSDESIMRTLGRDYNVVGREAMVLGFYRRARPVASSAPRAGRVSRTAVLRVTTHDLPDVSITWTVDGEVVARDQATLSVASLGLSAGAHDIAVLVADETPWVLPSADRDRLLTQAVTWQVA